MPIKVFAEPGHDIDDFRAVEAQVNEWERSTLGRIVDVHFSVNSIPDTLRDIGNLMFSVIIHYEE